MVTVTVVAMVTVPTMFRRNGGAADLGVFDHAHKPEVCDCPLLQQSSRLILDQYGVSFTVPQSRLTEDETCFGMTLSLHFAPHAGMLSVLSAALVIACICCHEPPDTLHQLMRVLCATK